MSWVVEYPVTNSLLQPLQIFVEESLIFQQHGGGYELTLGTVYKHPEASIPKVPEGMIAPMV